MSRYAFIISVVTHQAFNCSLVELLYCILLEDPDGHISSPQGTFVYQRQVKDTRQATILMYIQINYL